MRLHPSWLRCLVSALWGALLSWGIVALSQETRALDAAAEMFVLWIVFLLLLASSFLEVAND